MTNVLNLTWAIAPADLSDRDRERVADLLSAYAADLRKGAAVGGRFVPFELASEERWA